MASCVVVAAACCDYVESERKLFGMAQAWRGRKTFASAESGCRRWKKCVDWAVAPVGAPHGRNQQI